MELVDRPLGREWLERWRDKDVIKVVTGVRRCGKSTLLALFRASLHDAGVPADRLIDINLEDPNTAELAPDWLSLYRLIESRLVPGHMNYVFIDEIQQIQDFERAADGLALKPNVDLYVTGSNAGLLAGDLATRLTGRYVELPLLPLSFRDWRGAIGRFHPDSPPRTVEDDFAAYRRDGGFPFLLRLDEEASKREYLSGIVDTVLFRDVMDRQRVTDGARLRALTEYLLDATGSLASAKSIADTLTSKGRKTAAATVDSYVSGLVDAFLVYPAKRYDVKGKRLLERLEKYYAVDTGIRRAVTGRDGDLGRQLETIVYLELLRRRYEVRVGKVGAQEIDFIASKDGVATYVQVSQSVLDPATRARELRPLRAVRDFAPRVLLTLDPGHETEEDGIRRENALTWLLADPA